MKIVIDIPDEEYEGLIKEHAYKTCGIGEEYYEVIIANGTPIPKGCGRLISAKQAEERLRQAFDEHEGYNSLARYIVRNPSETPTIIEADKGEGEQE